jgi:predicted SnoaL-like aldol condensation-catalyzing enzyme
VIAGVLVSAIVWSGVSQAASQKSSNTKTALALTKAMQEQNVALASSYLTDGYIQHNPNVPTGKDGYVKFFSNIWKSGPKPASATLANPPVFIVAQGDKVVLIFKNPLPDPAAPGKTYDSFNFDAYRFENGKIAEHWDGYLKRPAGPPPTSTP